jgi:hypothetical protein
VTQHRSTAFAVADSLDSARQMRVRWSWMPLLVVAALSMSCASQADDRDTRASGCVAGQSIGCVGPSGCEGYQICADDGASYGSCQCGSKSSGSSNSTTSTNVGAGGASSRNTAATGGVRSSSVLGLGGVSTLATGGAATGVGIGGASTCAPAQLPAAWASPKYVPARPAQAVCADTEVQDYIAQCMHGTNCAAFEPGGASAACGQCLSPTPLSAASLGPILEILPAPFYRWETNFAGCIELLGAKECAAKLQALTACTSAACSSGCDPTTTTYDTCVVQARTASCSSYAQQASCLTDSSMASRCSGTDFTTSVLAAARVFCGAR